MRYVIFTSEEDEGGKTVGAFDLYKFKVPEDNVREIPECQEIVPFEGDSNDKAVRTATATPESLQQVKDEVKNRDLATTSRRS